MKILNINLLQNYRWNIAYKFTDKWEDINLGNAKQIPNPPNRYLADPFIVKKDQNHYCQPRSSNSGCPISYRFIAIWIWLQ